jgi:hypothetical protein
MADLPNGFALSPAPTSNKIEDDEKQRDRSEPFVGRAVDAGRVRFLSVSQIKLYDHDQHGGCKRKYAFKYHFRVKISDETESTRAGREEYAKSLEIYLKTGEDVMPPVLRAAKHLFPKPGPDVDSEKPLGDHGAAVTLRDALLYGGLPSKWDLYLQRKLSGADERIERATAEGDTERLKGLAIERRWIVDAATFIAATPLEARPERTAAEIARLAGLTANGIPFDGAADFRHRRGWYVNDYGMLVQEDPGLVVFEVGDLKSTKQISDRVNRKKEVIRGYAKTVEQVLDDPQMLGYGVHGANLYPDATHARLTHVYVQTQGTLCGERRSGLLTVEEVRQRWRRVDKLAADIEDMVANTSSPDDVPYNIAACNAYNRRCPYDLLCKRDMPVSVLLQLREPGQEENKSMSNGFFDSVSSNVPPPPPNGATVQSAGFFGSSTTTAPAVSAPPPPPPQTDAERAAAVEAAKSEFASLTPLQRQAVHFAGIDGYTVGMGCNGVGFYATQNPQHLGGHLVIEPGHVHNANCKVPVQQPPAVGQVNPPDSPPHDPVSDAAPLTPEQIAQIADPEIRARAESNAVQHAGRAAAEVAANPKAEKKGGRCPSSNQKIQLTIKEASDRKKTCSCGKEHKIKPDQIIFEVDTPFFVVPSHNLPKVETPTAPPSPAPVQQMLPTVVPPAVASPPPPEPTVASPSPPAPSLAVVPPPPSMAAVTPDQATQLLVTDITKRIARALIEALKPFAEES